MPGSRRIGYSEISLGMSMSYLPSILPLPFLSWNLHSEGFA